jgi:glucose/arabinose dehydrogenase
VVERPGRIRIIADGATLAEPFLDISDRVEAGGSEQGLLSVAFAPDYASSGRFYVFYTARGGEGVGANTIARFVVSAEDPNRADLASGETLLAVPDVRVNHNGGQLQFGPDGLLYAGFGDGGGGGDPDNNGQNPATILGGIIRIDVSGERGYAIPADNPWADGQEGTPEGWVIGLRNPWRFSFDRENGDLWIGDVGQNQIEEINRVPFAEATGANFGWNWLEGSQCFRAEGCDPSLFVAPVAEYDHRFGCSVTGGYVYRGAEDPALDGVYLFADFCTGLLWGMGADGSGWAMSEPQETGLNISSFAEDAAGELYLLNYGGDLFRIRAAA